MRSRTSRRRCKRYEGRVAITALHGLRGVGKTMLAAAYAERHRGDYRATWWIRAETEAGMRADLVGARGAARLGRADDKEEPALAAIDGAAAARGRGHPADLRQRGRCRRAQPLPAARRRGAGPGHLERTTPGAASPSRSKFACGRRKSAPTICRPHRPRRPSATAAEDLSEALGGLPLAHEQAAAYCERLDISLAEYGKRFAAAPARLLDAAGHAPAEYHDGLTVAKTFALAIEEAAKLHPAAEPLIVHAALLAPEPIPLFLFSEGARAIRRAASLGARRRRPRRSGGGAARLCAHRPRDDR